MKYLVSIPIFLGFLNGCGKSTSSDTKAIIGNDTRTIVPSNEMVGTLNYKGYAICSAFASGPNEITTAAHCIISNDINHYSVDLGYHTGWSKKVKTIALYENADIAVLGVDNVTDYLKTAKFNKDLPATLLGYAEDLTKTVEASGTMTEGAPGTFDHNFSTVNGASGSPILQDGKVVAVHLGSIKEPLKNVAVKYDKFQNVELGNLKYQIDKEGFWSNLGRNIDPTNPHGQLRKSLAGIDPTDARNAVRIAWCGGVFYVTPILVPVCTSAIATVVVACPTAESLVMAPACGAGIASAVTGCGATIAGITEGIKKCLSL